MKTTLLTLLAALTFALALNSQDLAGTSSASNRFDYSLLKQMVAGKRVVALGESSHGIGDFYALKSDIVRYLHEELGYEVLALEGGFGEANLAWQAIEDLSYADLRDRTIFGNYQCQEMSPLFEHIKTSSSSEAPLHYAGIDIQISGNYYTDQLQAICDLLKIELNVDEELGAFGSMYRSAFEPDSTNFIRYRDSYQLAVSQLKDALVKNKSKIQAALGWSNISCKILHRSLVNQYAAVDFTYANRMTANNVYRGMVIRDRLMAENVIWLMDELYPDEKIIIWGHNAHIEKEPLLGKSTPWMGQLLKDQLGDDYYSIGFFAYKGEAYQHWTRETIPFENSDPAFLEYKMKDDQWQYNIQRLDVKSHNDDNVWMREPVKALEMENNGVVEFIPVDRFDAVVCLKEVGAPNFDTSKE